MHRLITILIFEIFLFSIESIALIDNFIILSEKERIVEYEIYINNKSFVIDLDSIMSDLKIIVPLERNFTSKSILKNRISAKIEYNIEYDVLSLFFSPDDGAYYGRLTVNAENWLWYLHNNKYLLSITTMD